MGYIYSVWGTPGKRTFITTSSKVGIMPEVLLLCATWFQAFSYYSIEVIKHKNPASARSGPFSQICSHISVLVYRMLTKYTRQPSRLHIEYQEDVENEREDRIFPVWRQMRWRGRNRRNKDNFSIYPTF